MTGGARRRDKALVDELSALGSIVGGLASLRVGALLGDGSGI